MTSINPATGQPLADDAIQRVLFVAPQVHVYQIPPLASTKGYKAASWTEDPKRHIFTARLRVLETEVDQDSLRIDLVLEDPSSGQLFAAAPYTSADVVEAALDSARFFAVRVQDGQGRKALLGIGFEERPEAFDFGVALQEARKEAAPPPKITTSSATEEKRDYSLKEGETITVNLKGRASHRKTETPASSSSGGGGGFSLPPPPPLPPPPRSRSLLLLPILGPIDAPWT